MKLFKLILIFFLFFTITNIYCQKEAYIQYTTKDGLSSNYVYMGYQDSKGFMWFGTDSGLSRFDGYSFKNFDIQDGLPDNDIFDMLEDKKGRIWFATYNGKIGYLYNRKFYNSSNSKILQGHDFNSYISCMFEDKKGRIWFGSRNGDIKYLDTNGIFHQISKKKIIDTKNELHTYALWENNIGDIYALTNNALENITKNESISLNDIHVKLGLKDSRHYKTLTLNNGNLVISENSNFYILDKNYTKVLKKTSFNKLNNTVLFLEKETSEHLWAGTYKGIFKLNLEKEQPISSVEFLKDLTISSRKKDRQGNLWFTTLEKGIYFSPNIKVINYTVNDPLPEEKVNAIDGNNNGEILIGQKKKYSFLIDEQIYSFDEDPQVENLKTNSSSKHIYDVSLKNNRDFIICSTSGVITNTKGQKNYYSRPIRTAVDYKKDSIIMGFSNLLKAKKTNLGFLSQSDQLPEKILSTSVITIIYWDEKDDSLWVGTIDGLLQIKNGKKINHYKNNPFLGSHISDIKPSKNKNEIWISTNGNGIFLIDKKGTIKLHLTKEDGLSSNICKTIIEDDAGKLWIATNDGLYKLINKESKNITRYGITDGLLNDNINDVFVHKNKVWVATNQGLSLMDISEEKNHDIPIYITNTKVNGNYKNFNKKNNTLSHQENNISIDFVALNYNMGGKIVYRYKIKKNQEWRYTSTNRLEFSSLKNGTYSFIIQAKNKQGNWGKESKILNFEITKPWWLRFWAILLYVLIFLIFIVSIFQYIAKKRALNHELLLEKKQSIKLKELDQFKSQFFTNISHEIRTPLTLINGYVDDFNLKTHNKVETSGNIKKQIHKITHIVDSVLDLAKMQSSDFKLHLTNTNISDLVYKLYINFKPLFNQKNVDFLISYNQTSYFSNTDTIFFEKAINNLILNALKYTNTGKVTINIYDENDTIIINIIDTGIGISNKNINKVFDRFYQINNDINAAGGSGIGLAFCKEIIEMHAGSISLKSQTNKGSQFTITLPLTYKTTCLVSENEVYTSENVIENKSINSIESNFLIVDDNYDMRKYLISILKPHHCIEASNGEEAIEVIASKEIDFIITDYMMPKLNGYDLVYKLNQQNSEIPIIMLTAKNDIDAKLNVLKLGVNDYITKPFNKNELLTRINNCIKNNTAKRAFIKKHNIISNESDNDTFITELKLYITKNLNNNSLNQDVIADNFNLSKSSFYRKVKSTTGLSPTSFIKEIRLQKAREIVAKNTDISLKELSFKVGFSHTSYFSKMYENRFGVKP